MMKTFGASSCGASNPSSATNSDARVSQYRKQENTMQGQAAQAARASAPVRSEIDWSKADDDTLVRGLLKRRDFAWLAFLGRVDEIVKERVALTASRRSGLAYSA